MKIKEPLKIRVRDSIYDAATGALDNKHASISAAKKASRLWQQSNGEMGDGRLRVSDKPPQVST